METETNGIDPRNKRYWLGQAREAFGPGVELARVSSSDRFSRFVIALGSIKLDGARAYSPVVLGAGDSYEAALRDSESTETGKLARGQWKEFVAEKMAEIEKVKQENDDLSKPAEALAGEAADSQDRGDDSEGPGASDVEQRKVDADVPGAD